MWHGSRTDTCLLRKTYHTGGHVFYNLTIPSSPTHSNSIKGFRLACITQCIVAVIGALPTHFGGAHLCCPRSMSDPEYVLSRQRNLTTSTPEGEMSILSKVMGEWMEWCDGWVNEVKWRQIGVTWMSTAIQERAEVPREWWTEQHLLQWHAASSMSHTQRANLTIRSQAPSDVSCAAWWWVRDWPMECLGGGLLGSQYHSSVPQAENDMIKFIAILLSWWYLLSKAHSKKHKEQWKSQLQAFCTLHSYIPYMH